MSDPTSQEPSKAQEFSRGYGPTDKRFADNLDWVKKVTQHENNLAFSRLVEEAKKTKPTTGAGLSPAGVSTSRGVARYNSGVMGLTKERKRE